ncbi:hypothetical protein [Dyadobacter frigoris]|uniref:hypothetical protein n=1 Tax=Dyadobacter frigoris TaxID=2576211 RepID=UPI001484D38E|nr:hypothetical protein [Dyadobacter frigoris]
MAITVTKSKRSLSANQILKSAEQASTIEKKMAQMRETLKKHPLPSELLRK